MIHHVALEVARADADACVEFWRLLGFAAVDPPGSLGERSRWVARDGRQVHLMLAEAPTVPPNGHVALHVPDYEATCARLREAGFEPEPRERHWGAARAFVRSPGGHRVELMAAPPP